MTTASLRLLALLPSLALPLAAQTVTTTLLNDTFADGDRTTQSPPSSAQWLVSGTSGNMNVTGGALVSTSSMTNVAYFTAAGSPVTLAAGESLTLSFSVSFSSVSNSVGLFRVGLFNSGTRLANDNFQNTNAAFTGSYAGYFGAVNTGATSGTNILRVYERPNTLNTLLAGSISNYTQTGGSVGGAFKTFVAGNVYSGVLTLSRTDATTVSIFQSYTGIFGADSSSSTVSGTVSDTSGITASFDTFGLFYNLSGQSVTLDNIKIDYTSVSSVPEPSSAAALVGALALSATALRRRRRA